MRSSARRLLIDVGDIHTNTERKFHVSYPLSPWYAGIPMRRNTVKLPDDLDARLRHEAERRGVTIADVTRTALEQHLGAGGRRRLSAAASGRSGQSDISERIEEILASEIAPSR